MQVGRSKKGWTQKELATKLKCKVQLIQEYEQGKVTKPNRSFARRIEKVIDYPLFK